MSSIVDWNIRLATEAGILLCCSNCSRKIEGACPRCTWITQPAESCDEFTPGKKPHTPGGALLKDTNPKDPLGTKKWRQYCTVPLTIIWELGVAMLEGARKYGRHNYRVTGVRASVYVDAIKGHIDQYWEGEDIDPESGLHHLTKAMGSLAVLRDAQINNMCKDDRPPKIDINRIRKELQASVDDIFERYPECKKPFTELRGKEDD